MSNAYTELATLPENLVAEAIREGELRVNAQLAVAMASDQRALTLAGFQITLATASLAGAFALMTGVKPDRVLVLVAAAFACGMILAGGISIWTIRPKDFFLPGNKPGNWLPSRWAQGLSESERSDQARAEQASVLDMMIDDNAEYASACAARVNLSITVMLLTTCLGLLATAAIILNRW